MHEAVEVIPHLFVINFSNRRFADTPHLGGEPGNDRWEPGRGGGGGLGQV